MGSGNAHLVVEPFAGEASNPEAVSVSCDFFRSLVSPFKQPDEHAEGVGTLLALACSGSAGQRLSSALSSLTVEAPHPVSISASSVTLALKVIDLVLRISGLLIGKFLIPIFPLSAGFDLRLLGRRNLTHCPVVPKALVVCGQPQVRKQHGRPCRHIAPRPAHRRTSSKPERVPCRSMVSTWLRFRGPMPM